MKKKSLQDHRGGGACAGTGGVEHLWLIRCGRDASASKGVPKEPFKSLTPLAAAGVASLRLRFSAGSEPCAAGARGEKATKKSSARAQVAPRGVEKGGERRVVACDRWTWSKSPACRRVRMRW